MKLLLLLLLRRGKGHAMKMMIWKVNSSRYYSYCYYYSSRKGRKSIRFNEIEKLLKINRSLESGALNIMSLV